MKNSKNILFAILAMLSIGFITTSCNDKFSESDLLQLQVQLGTEKDSLDAARQLAALNAAGELVSFQVMVVNTDGAGVESLDVTLGAASSDGTPDDQTLVTNANGSVYFNRVVVGGNNLRITGASIMDATLTLDFGNLRNGTHYQIINGNVIPIPVTENAIITVLGATTATATVTGVASIETDLTNTTKEVPQNVTVMADFNDNLVERASINVNYFFPTNDVMNLGSAVVDNTTGAYTMTVPAGVRFDITIPEIQASQRIAVNGFDGQDLPRPEYRDILTNFGSNFGTDNIPTVPGALAVFSQPTMAGRGFNLGSFSQEGRAIQAFTFSSNTYTITEPTEPSSDIIVQFNNLGAGYTNSPVVGITDAGSGTGAYAEAWIESAITGLTITDAGTGYPAAINTYSFELWYDEIDQNGTNVDQQLTFFGPLDIDTDAAGAFTATTVQAALTAAITNGDTYFDAANLEQIGDNISNLRLINSDFTTDAVIAVSSAMGRVYQLRVFDGGSNYTNPTFAFSGGGASSQANLSVLEFGTQWLFNVDNSGISAPYTLLPQNILLEYNQITTGSAGVASSTSAQNVETNSSSGLISLLNIDSNGDIQFVDQTASYKTTFNSTMAPRVLITEPESITAARFIRPYEINSDGQVTGMSTGGWATNFTSSNGEGYSSQFNVTIEPSISGAPGSGASIVITGGTNASSGEYQWGGSYNVLNGGTGYLVDLNTHNGTGVGGNNRISYNVGGDVTYILLDAGTTHVVDINYGTGNKTINVY